MPNPSVTYGTEQQAVRNYIGGLDDYVESGTLASGEGALTAGSVIAKKTSNNKIYGVRLGNLAGGVVSAATSITLTKYPFFKAGEIIAFGNVASATILSVNTSTKVISLSAAAGNTASAGDAVSLATADGRESPIGILKDSADSTSADVSCQFRRAGLFFNDTCIGFSAAVNSHAGMKTIHAI